jgi:hypothetical protein
VGGSLGTGTVVGGLGPQGGEYGQAFGGGLFLQGNETITLAPPADPGQTQETFLTHSLPPYLPTGFQKILY